MERIKQIEIRRKTPEYEGNVREVQATGSMDVNGATAMQKCEQVVLAGGNVEG